MTEYYVIRNKDTGLYFRGKGVNRWGKYFNQASIYRIKGMAEHSVKEVAWHDEQAEVVPIQILEVKCGEWLPVQYTYFGLKRYECSECKDDEYWQKRYLEHKENFCPNCGAKMDGKDINVPTK